MHKAALQCLYYSLSAQDIHLTEILTIFNRYINILWYNEASRLPRNNIHNAALQPYNHIKHRKWDISQRDSHINISNHQWMGYPTRGVSFPPTILIPRSALLLWISMVDTSPSSTGFFPINSATKVSIT